MCVGQFSRGGQVQSFAEIAEQHVGALDEVKGRFESTSDGFFYETFFQTDAQVSADNLHDVFGFERSGSLEKRAQKRSFGGRPTGRSDPGKCSLYFGEREAENPALREAPRLRPIRRRRACGKFRSVRTRTFPIGR